MPPLLYLSAADVGRVLTMSDAVESMRRAFLELQCGKIDMPPRGRLETGNDHVSVLLMPCHAGAQRCYSLKCLTVVPENPTRGLPLIQALLLLFDTAEGIPLAIMDGAAVTAIRTGAAAGVATDLLARKNASSVALFGAGAQSRTQLAAICSVRNIRTARVFDLDRERRVAFAADMSRQLDLDVEAADCPSQAMRGVDIVCTATTAREPVFLDTDVPSGLHINAVGAFHADCAEIPAATVQRARVVVDHLPAALEEAGDLLRPLAAGLIDRDHFGTELGQVLSGQRPGRSNAQEITLFKSVGIAVQDLYAAQTAYEQARRAGLGVQLPR